MRKSFKTATLAGLLLVASLTTACYGPFNATRNFHQWNGSVSENKWVDEGLFLIPGCIVYPLCLAGDSLIFNSIEFWGGENPIKLSAMNQSGTVPATVGLESLVAILPVR